MKTALLLSILFAANFAHARSPHPCTPSVQAQPSQLWCGSADGKLQYAISIETLMSDVTRGCTGENYYEYKTAKVKVYDVESGALAEEIEIANNDFSYELGNSFKSEKNGLDLQDCISPMNGGASVGNRP